MGKCKNQKGAISLFVVLSMMFFITIVLSAFTIANRRNMVQIEALKETQSIYNSGANASDIYDSIIAPSGTSIPITSKEHLKALVDVKNSTNSNIKISYIVDGNLYTCKKETSTSTYNASYFLQDDIILDLKDEINEKNVLTLYDYILYDGTYNIDKNGNDIFYAQADGSLWKCVYHHYIGSASTNAQVFSATEGNANYYGKSYSNGLYSVLDEEIDTYKKAWDTNTNYEFMLMYNTDNSKFNVEKYNRWRQTNNPTQENIADTGTSTGSQVTGYTIGYAGGTTAGLGYGNCWGGLALSTSANCYLDGSVGHQNWYYAIGSTVWFSTYGIPTSQTAGNGANEALLFVRAK